MMCGGKKRSERPSVYSAVPFSAHCHGSADSTGFKNRSSRYSSLRTTSKMRRAICSCHWACDWGFGMMGGTSFFWLVCCHYSTMYKGEQDTRKPPVLCKTPGVLKRYLGEITKVKLATEISSGRYQAFARPSCSWVPKPPMLSSMLAYKAFTPSRFSTSSKKASS